MIGRPSGIALILAFALSGCASDSPVASSEAIPTDGEAKYDVKTGALTELRADRNKDGRMDTFSYWEGGRVQRIEMDQDEDGKRDRWEYYDAQNKVVRVGSSSRDDQVQDTWAYPDAEGFLARVETDSNRDGLIDKRERFVPRPEKPSERVLVLVESEFNKAGQPGFRMHYRADGSFERSETLR